MYICFCISYCLKDSIRFGFVSQACWISDILKEYKSGTYSVYFKLPKHNGKTSKDGFNILFWSILNAVFWLLSFISPGDAYYSADNFHSLLLLPDE